MDNQYAAGFATVALGIYLWIDDAVTPGAIAIVVVGDQVLRHVPFYWIMWGNEQFI